MRQYSYDPFGDGNAKEISTGKEIDASIIAGLVGADKLGNEKYL